MGHHDRHDNDRILGSLCLMHGCRIGQDDFIQLRYVILDLTVIKGDQDLAIVNGRNPSDVPVEHLFVIVVPNLHHPIIDAVRIPATVDFLACPRWVKACLQLLIERCRADRSALHGRQHLNLIAPDVKVSGQALFYQVHDGLCCLFRIFLFHIEKIRLLSIAQIREFPVIDPMRIGDDPTRCRLPENPRQLHDRNRL